jgi:hypothetical protein
MRRLTLLIITLCAFTIAGAQGVAESPLLRMLAKVPDTPAARAEILFSDRAAITAAYPPAQMPASFAAFDALMRGSTSSFPALELWFNIFSGTSTDRMAMTLHLAEEMPALVGFDFFDVQHELTYGSPPQQGFQFGGTFDIESVRAALSSAGYAAVDADAGELWCPESACDAGSAVNFALRNPANPFGGDLGRRFPLIIAPDTLIASPDEALIQGHLAVAVGASPSLASAPAYSTAVALLAEGGVLMQAAIYPPAAAAPNASGDTGLPPFTLFALGDVAAPDAQQTRVVLVYEDMRDAERAAELLPSLLNLPGGHRERPWNALLADSHITEITSEAVLRDDGLPAVILTLSGRRGTPEQILGSESAAFAEPGGGFRLVLNGLWMRDLSWLNTAG